MINYIIFIFIFTIHWRLTYIFLDMYIQYFLFFMYLSVDNDETSQTYLIVTIYNFVLIALLFALICFISFS